MRKSGMSDYNGAKDRAWLEHKLKQSPHLAAEVLNRFSKKMASDVFVDVDSSDTGSISRYMSDRILNGYDDSERLILMIRFAWFFWSDPYVFTLLYSDEHGE